MAQAHTNRPAATLKNMPHHILSKIASELKNANLAQFATVNKTGPGKVARNALIPRKVKKNGKAAGEFQKIVDFFKPWIDGFGKAIDETADYMKRVPGLSAQQYIQYIKSRYAIHLPLPEHVDPQHGQLHLETSREQNGPTNRSIMKARCSMSNVPQAPFIRNLIAVQVEFGHPPGSTHWRVMDRGFIIQFWTPDFRPIVVISNSDRRPARTVTEQHEFDDSKTITLHLPQGISVMTNLNKTADVIDPGFYVRRYSILGEPWWRSVRADPYARLPSSHAYPIDALYHVIKRLFDAQYNAKIADAYKHSMRLFTVKAQADAALIIQNNLAHALFSNNVMTILQRRDPQILTNADVQRLVSSPNNATKRLLQPRLEKNAREGSGNAFRRRVFGRP